MKNKFSLPVKIVILTFIFAVVLLASIIITTLIVQGNIHPDNWVTTTHEIVVGSIVVFIYLATISKQLKKYRSNK